MAIFRVLMLAVLLGLSCCIVSSFQPSGRCRMPSQLRVTRSRPEKVAEESSSGFGNVSPFQSAKKNTPLTKRPGARPLTKAELKAKEQYEEQLDKVERVHSPESRVSLSQLSTGQKVRGRIISVKEFGLFVDVGSKRDGLVHIKDVSKDYFVSNLESKFVPGQDVDVWVKFVEEKAYKLGLQMFPVDADAPSSHRSRGLPSDGSATDLASADQYLGEPRTSLEAYEVEQEVTGKVVKVSTFGAFVDIGAEVLAFLHKRKMNVSPKRRALKTWEITPVGSTVTCWVHEVELGRRRVSVSSYSPDRWAEMLPMRSDMNTAGASGETGVARLSRETELSDDRFSNAALERTLALTLSDGENFNDEDDDDNDDYADNASDEDDDGADGEGGDNLSPAEIRALLAGTNRANAKIGLDDFATVTADTDTSGRVAEMGASRSNPNRRVTGEQGLDERAAREAVRSFHASNQVMGKGPPRSSNSQPLDELWLSQGEEVDIEEIFAELLPYGKSHLTYKEIKRWDYVQLLLEDGDIDEKNIKNLIAIASGVDMSSKEGDIYDKAASGKLDVIAFDEFVDLLADSLGLEDANEWNGSEEEEEEEEEGELYFEVLPDVEEEGDIDGLEMELGEMVLGDDEYDEDDEEHVLTIETSSTSASGSVSASEGRLAALERALEGQVGDIDEDDEDDAFLQEMEQAYNAEADIFEDGDGDLEGLAALAKDKKPRSSDLLKYVFDGVSGGKAHVTLQDAMKWDFVEALLKKKTLSRRQVEAAFTKSSVKSNKSKSSKSSKIVKQLSPAEFDTFMGILSENETENKDKMSNEALIQSQLIDTGDEDISEVDLSVSVSGSGELPLELSPSSSQSVLKALASDVAASDGVEYDDDEEEDLEDLEDGYEEVTIEEAFEGISGGKKIVSLQQVAEWEVVKELIEAGQIDMAELKDMFQRAGAKGRNTLTLDGFESLLDLLEPITEIFDGDEEEEVAAEQGLMRFTEDSSTSAESNKGNKGNKGNKVAIESDKTDADADDVDDAQLLGEVFASIANKKAFASRKDLLNWDFVLDLMGEGLLTEESLNEQMLAAGGGDKGIALESFDTLVDNLVLLYGEESEGEEGGDDDDEGGEIIALEANTEADADADTEEDHDHDHDEEEGEYYDVDIETAFAEIAKGKDTVSITDVLKWDLISQMKDATLITEEEVLALVETAGVEDSSKMSKLDFEAFVDELTAGSEEFDDYEPELM